jgi:hypothetical protein
MAEVEVKIVDKSENGLQVQIHRICGEKRGTTILSGCAAAILKEGYELETQFHRDGDHLLDQVERICSSIIAWLELWIERKKGIKRARWPSRGSPPGTEGAIFRTNWTDHCYVEKHPDGTTKFISHPYGLDNNGLQELAALSMSGWDVSIDAGSTHFPGRTVKVIVSKKENK